MTTKTDDLKRCPFCGGDHLKLFGESAPEWWVSCQTCFAASRTAGSKDNAIAAWNARAALQSQDAEDAERYRWLLEQAWFQEAFDRFDPDDGGSLPRFVSECARIIDRARRVEGEKP